MSSPILMKKPLLALLGALCLCSCANLDVPDLNNPSVELLQTQPTRSAISASAAGLLIGMRTDVALPNGYISMLAILGREEYDLDVSDPRYITEMLEGPRLDPGSPRFGGAFWVQPYANIRNANLLLNALDQVQFLTDAEKEAARGYAKTLQAVEFQILVDTRDTNGAVVDVSGPPLGALGPIVSKEQVFAHIDDLLEALEFQILADTRDVNGAVIDVGGPALGPLGAIVSKGQVFAHIDDLLDQAQTHLKAGGDHFPFPLSSGFRGFDTPVTFLQFNRAVKARADVYQGRFADALTEMSGSFVSTTSSLDVGTYHVFGSGSGDTLNLLISPTIYVHPSVVADAEHKSNGDLDDRVTHKVRAVAPRTYAGLTSSYAFTRYPTNTTPVPIIRNEELILLRAEANLGLGKTAEAAADINFIRVNSGGLAPLPEAQAATVDQLLMQRRYSLLFEGHRWIDVRRYGRLNTLPIDEPGFTVHDKFPIPTPEMDPRQ